MERCSVVNLIKSPFSRRERLARWIHNRDETPRGLIHLELI